MDVTLRTQRAEPVIGRVAKSVPESWGRRRCARRSVWIGVEIEIEPFYRAVPSGESSGALAGMAALTEERERLRPDPGRTDAVRRAVVKDDPLVSDLGWLRTPGER